jgi:signal transduction histidine kinase
MGEELASGQDAAQPPEFKVQLAGTPRDLVPLVRTEIYWIAREALRNAFKHAHAKQISVAIDYNKQGLRLRIEDDGAGTDPEVLREGAAAGHYGLLGLRERARLIGAKLAIRSEFREGTEIELSLPGSAAYVKPDDGRA